ncbi:MAG: serine O-acetyltransferase EpsC [Myxococcota bacterium]
MDAKRADPTAAVRDLDRDETLNAVLEDTIDALSKCADDALSKAVCEGVLDPQEAIVWVERTERLVLYQRDRSALRSEVPVVADHLRALLHQLELQNGLKVEAIVRRFMARLPGIRRMLAEDVEAALEGDPAAKSFAEIVVSYPSIRALAVYRIAHELHRLGVPLLPRIMSEYSHDHTGIDIHPGAQIGRRFFIDHGTGVVIGETTEIGDSVRLYQGVTLGAKSPRHGESLRGVKRHPIIEDEVTIYAGATILGGDVVIGQGSVIGGNVWLTESVPAGSRVVAESARHLVRQRSDRDSDEARQLYWDI